MKSPLKLILEIPYLGYVIVTAIAAGMALMGALIYYLTGGQP